MARAGSGTACFISSAELAQGGRLESKLIDQLKSATLPALNRVLVDWSEAFWRLAELSAVFRPASTGSFFKFYQWVTRRLHMGTSVLAIATYTDASRQAHAGSSRLLRDLE